ncbi:MAG TPA: prolipoprotein diacylglyceryl transferase family protein [Candidatus Limnocylindrales bacterium]
MPTAIIAFTFDPYVSVAGQTVRWETLALAGVILLVIVLTGLIAGRARADLGEHGLRRDDLLFIILGIVPGAVIGGRLTYVLIHLDYYHANPGLIFDPSSGSLALTGAVVLGTLSGCYVARLLDAPVGRWLDVAAIGLIIGLALGKLANVLGANGQGLVSSVTWATAYLGPGPWAVLGPELPAQPAQVYEALGDAVVIVGLLVAAWFGPFRAGHGRRFLLVLAGWAIVRFAVAFTWRDAPVLGSLRVEQILDLGLLIAALAGLAASRRSPATIEAATPSSPLPAAPAGGPVWPGSREDAS